MLRIYNQQSTVLAKSWDPAKQNILTTGARVLSTLLATAPMLPMLPLNFVPWHHSQAIADGLHGQAKVKFQATWGADGIASTDGIWCDNNSQSVYFCPSCSITWCLTNGLSHLDGGAFLNRRVVRSQRDCTRSLEILQGGSRDWDRLLSMNASADGENLWWPHNKISFFFGSFTGQ